MTKDITTKKYMQNNIRFADLFNFYLFDGEAIIKPDNLKELDTNHNTIFNDSSISRYRDLYKEAVIMDDNDKTYVLLLGLENQNEINYGMVIRNMLYDALSYQKQIDIRKRSSSGGMFYTLAKYVLACRKNLFG